MSDTEIDSGELRTSIRDVLDTEAASDRVHKHYDSGEFYDASLASTVAELGWATLSVDESHGGLGLGPASRSILYEELGRGPAPLPMLPTMLAAQALTGQESLGEAAQALLGDILAGTAFAGWVADAAGLTVANGTISGRIEHVLDGAAARAFILSIDDGNAALISVDTPGVTVEAVATVDRTRSFATLSLEAVAFVPLRVDRSALLQHALLGIAADSVGGAEAILEKTVEYLKTRTQFGKPIGSFQALKHRVANHHTDVIMARCLLEEALLLGTDSERGLALAMLAKSTAADIYAAVADDAVQLHGGIGYTWEQDCHLYLKRAKLNQQLFGDTVMNLDAAARMLVEAA